MTTVPGGPRAALRAAIQAAGDLIDNVMASVPEGRVDDVVLFDPSDAAQDIDADIVQRKLIEGVLGVNDARDERITYVGANRDAAARSAMGESSGTRSG